MSFYTNENNYSSNSSRDRDRNRDGARRSFRQPNYSSTVDSDVDSDHDVNLPHGPPLRDRTRYDYTPSSTYSGSGVSEDDRTSDFPSNTSGDDGIRSLPPHQRDGGDNEPRQTASATRVRNSTRRRVSSQASKSDRLRWQFVGISFDDFKGCAQFIGMYPEILNEDMTALTNNGRLAYQEGKEDLGDRYIHRAIIIWLCKTKGFSTTEQKMRYVRSLANETSEDYNEFMQDYKNLKSSACGRGNRFSSARDTANYGRQRTMPAIASRERSVHIDLSIGERLNDMEIGDQSDSQSSQVSSTRRGYASYAPPPSVDRRGSFSQSPVAVRSPPRSPYQFDNSSTTGISMAGTQGRINSPRSPTGPNSSLNRNYQVRPRPEEFFRTGKVFKVLWHQPGGANVTGSVNEAEHSSGKFGEPIYSTLRWMMVIIPHQGYCICCPISTYAGQGLSSKKLNHAEIEAHAIVYAEGEHPIQFRDEPKMSKMPIPIRLSPSVPSLNPASRIHFGKLHTVEYNVKVMDVGEVSSKHVNRVLRYARQEFNLEMKS